MGGKGRIFVWAFRGFRGIDDLFMIIGEKVKDLYIILMGFRRLEV